MLTESARAVLRVLASSGPMTRPQLGTRLGLSKPTMSLAVEELVGRQLVAHVGTTRSAIGRSAVTYGLGPEAGFVVGIDAGTTHVAAVVSTLDNRIMGETSLDLGSDHPAWEASGTDRIREAVDGAIGQAGVTVDRLRSVAVAVPTIVSKRGIGAGRSSSFLDAVKPLPDLYGVPVLLENNVNCAALAELHVLRDENRTSFIYLQIGVKIGLGIVLGGNLFRGLNGAAGEVGRLPFPWSPTETPILEGLETYLGANSFLRRCRDGWPEVEQKPETAAEVFALSKSSAHARSCVERHAADIGRLAAACVGILDPGLVVLGGGVGENPLILERVSRVIADLTWTTETIVSRLAGRGSLLGAGRLAADYSLDLILGEDRHKNSLCVLEIS